MKKAGLPELQRLQARLDALEPVVSTRILKPDRKALIRFTPSDGSGPSEELDLTDSLTKVEVSYRAVTQESEQERELVEFVLKKQKNERSSSVPVGFSLHLNLRGFACGLIPTVACLPLSPKTEAGSFIAHYWPGDSRHTPTKLVIAALFHFRKTHQIYLLRRQAFVRVTVTEKVLQRRFRITRGRLRTILRTYPLP